MRLLYLLLCFRQGEISPRRPTFMIFSLLLFVPTKAR